MLNRIIIGLIIIWNIITFILMGIDKYKAMNSRWRIREKTLLIAAFLLGGFGIIFGMTVFRHKTLKLKFKILVPIAVIFNVGIIYYYFALYH